ncbi:MAG: hypothetical protein JF606_14790 [Burkholderiales bacterium]|nr:hypothetical protein [Burkholderiales bacterium]
MPPRAAVLRWPNGQTSFGRLAPSPPGTLNFLATEVEGPLAHRCQKADRIPRAQLDPGPFQVAVASQSADGDPLYVEATLLEYVPMIYPSMLKRVAAIAGGEGIGLDTQDQATLSRVTQGVLHHLLEGNCTDPTAVRRACNALERPSIELELTRVDHSGAASHDYRCNALSGEGFGDEAEGDLGEMLDRLKDGEHLYLNATHAIRGDAHSMAISATRLPGDRVRVSLFNPNGWHRVARSGSHSRIPAIAKTVSLKDARAALVSLAGGVIEVPVHMRGGVSPIWHDPAAGEPLFVWLSALNPKVQWHSTGQRMTPQKGPDCSVEVVFAWLASVLPEADYKLAKAHVLNILTQAALYHDLDKRVVERLRERVTSGLSAHAMATGRCETPPAKVARTGDARHP